MRLGGTEQLKVDVRNRKPLPTSTSYSRARGPLPRGFVPPPERDPPSIPPLRDRREDVPLLLAHFMERYCQENAKPLRQFTQAAMKLLMDYDWPGKRARAGERRRARGRPIHAGACLTRDLLPESIRSKGNCSRRAPAALGISAAASRRTRFAFLPRTIRSRPCFQIMDEIERRIIMDMLERTGWNQTEAARAFSHSPFNAQPEDQAARN